MIGHEYRPGTWIALVAEGGVALVHPDLGDRAARELWEAARAGARLGDRLGRLAARDAAELPAFAVVEAHPEGLRVLVRGDVVVTVGSARLTGEGHAPVHDVVLPGEAGFAMTAAGAPPDANPAATWLPLAGGIVHATQVRTFDTREHRQVGAHALRGADAEPGLPSSPALAALVGAGGGDALEDTAIEPAEDDADLTWASEPGAPLAGGLAVPTRASGLPGATYTIDIPEEDRLPGPIGPAARTADAPEPPLPPAVAQVPGPRPPSAALAAEPLLELVLPTGPRVPVTGPVVLGRAPEAGRVPGDEVPRLVAVPNPERGVSTTHAEVRPAGDYVVVTDLGSTNGTVLHLPGRPPQRLRPGTGVPVPPGGVVELGAEVRVVVERAEVR
ncbi:FHA domain-containing protein [Georgenia thermotolerans]|uniref:FHA domain-containing protein n=1 Tax=Georgenia thermotolerans TaxID=527326 RepID=A0A7J5UQP3_9MICO|nr:FHA domain-containing protein [Georgenia thermotolerans]KAE8764531.1 FHA domain-containing protein [Georgenia thermotolerans]